MNKDAVGFEQIRRLIQCQRLVRLAKSPTNVQFVEEACQRVGLGPGSKVIDVGCGPLGALPTLARIVGPSGVVVGVDNNQDVLVVGRQTLSADGLEHVNLVHADVNDPNNSKLASLGPYDVAYCRLFFINQRDPRATLRRVASLVRPGGHLIVHELLDDPAYPTFDPPVPAFGRFLHLVYACLRRQGKRPDLARHFSTLAREAGLQEVSRLELVDSDPRNAVDFLQEQGLGMLLVFKRALLTYGLATRDELDHLADEISEAVRVDYREFVSWKMVELIAKVPV